MLLVLWIKDTSLKSKRIYNFSITMKLHCAWRKAILKNKYKDIQWYFLFSQKVFQYIRWKYTMNNFYSLKIFSNIYIYMHKIQFLYMRKVFLVHSDKWNSCPTHNKQDFNSRCSTFVQVKWFDLTRWSQCFNEYEVISSSTIFSPQAFEILCHMVYDYNNECHRFLMQLYTNNKACSAMYYTCNW